MKKLLILFVVLCSTSAVNAVGIGITGGNSPEIGLSLGSGKSTNSYSFAASWQSGIYIHADFRRNFFFLSKNLPLFAGIGAKFQSRNTNLGVRIPLGVAMYLSKLEIFLELAPTLDLTPKMNFDVTPPFALGLRYHFKL